MEGSIPSVNPALNKPLAGQAGMQANQALGAQHSLDMWREPMQLAIFEAKKFLLPYINLIESARPPLHGLESTAVLTVQPTPRQTQTVETPPIFRVFT